MRRGLLVLVLLAVVLARPAGAHDIGSPAYVNYILDHSQTPDLAPGESGRLSFNFTNPYPWVMTNISLRLEVYDYREVNVEEPVVPATWPGPGPDFVDDAGNRFRLYIDPLVAGSLAPNASRIVSFTVVTYADTRHGSITSQGSYFVRTHLEFDRLGDLVNHSVMMSLGYFSDAEFQAARFPENYTCPAGVVCEGLLNLTYLGQHAEPPLDHLDGLLPDMGFSVQERMPLWPFVGLGGLMGASLVFAVLFYAEENPSKLPRVARWWLGVKGKARAARPRKRE